MEDLDEMLESLNMPNPKQMVAMMLHSIHLNSTNNKRIIKKKIKAYLVNSYGCLWNRNPITIDGIHSISIQASKLHYCWPKDNCGPYQTVEVGAPTFKLSKEFQKKFKSGGIYPNVPLAELYDELFLQLQTMKKQRQLEMKKSA